MDLLDFPQDLFWPGKTEPMSPDHKCLAPSTSPFSGATAGDAVAQQQLWPGEDMLLSYFDLEDDSSTTTTTFGQQYHDEDLKKTISHDVEVEEKKLQQPKIKPEELLQELLEMNEEGQWLNQENVDLSLLTDNSHADYLSTGGVTKVSDTGLDDSEATELIFNDIKSFCNDLEAAGLQQLTPPQSPPTSPMLVNPQCLPQMPQSSPTQQQLQQSNICLDAPPMNFGYGQRSCVDLQLQSNDCLDKTFVQSPQPSAAAAAVDPDLMALVDELLWNKTKDVHENYVLIGGHLPLQQPQPQSLAPQVARDESSMDYCDDNATQYSTPSYGNSLASSPTRSGSPQSLGGDDSQDDDDWTPPAPVEGKRGQKRSASGTSSASPVKRRPYERGGGEQEKKSRKKEQNKNAATRYRQKKKQEVETILEEEMRLQKTNKKLVAQFNEARREMKYLRNLLRDMYKQNNIII